MEQVGCAEGVGVGRAWWGRERATGRSVWSRCTFDQRKIIRYKLAVRKQDERRVYSLEVVLLSIT